MRKVAYSHMIISGCCAAWLKRLVAIILLFALLGTNCSRFYIYAGFKLNRSYIAKNLCENRSRPWLHCNGKCYFMKKIRQAADNEKKQTDKDSGFKNHRH